MKGVWFLKETQRKQQKKTLSMDGEVLGWVEGHNTTSLQKNNKNQKSKSVGRSWLSTPHIHIYIYIYVYVYIYMIR